MEQLSIVALLTGSLVVTSAISRGVLALVFHLMVHGPHL